MRKLLFFVVLFSLVGCQANRQVVGNTFISKTGPDAQITVAESFKYIGEQEWFYQTGAGMDATSTKVTHHLFAETDKKNNVKAILCIRYHHLPPRYYWDTDTFASTECLERGFVSVGSKKYHCCLFVHAPMDFKVAEMLEEAEYTTSLDYLSLCFSKALKSRDKVYIFYAKPYDRQANFKNIKALTKADWALIEDLKESFNKDVIIEKN